MFFLKCCQYIFSFIPDEVKIVFVKRLLKYTKIKKKKYVQKWSISFLQVFGVTEERIGLCRLVNKLSFGLSIFRFVYNFHSLLSWFWWTRLHQSNLFPWLFISWGNRWWCHILFYFKFCQITFFSSIHW